MRGGHWGRGAVASAGPRLDDYCREVGCTRGADESGKFDCSGAGVSDLNHNDFDLGDIDGADGCQEENADDARKRIDSVKGTAR